MASDADQRRLEGGHDEKLVRRKVSQEEKERGVDHSQEVGPRFLPHQVPQRDGPRSLKAVARSSMTMLPMELAA